MKNLVPILTLTFLIGCDERPKPSDIAPNFPSIVAAFKEAKDSAEGHAACLKSQVLLPRRLAEAQSLYNDARTANDKAIAYVRAALQSSIDSFSRDELGRLLRTADTSRSNFENWYLERRKAKEVSECSCGAAGVDVLFGIADVVIKLVQLQDQRAAEQRAAIDKQLESYYWAPWKQAD